MPRDRNAKAGRTLGAGGIRRGLLAQSGCRESAAWRGNQRRACGTGGRGASRGAIYHASDTGDASSREAADGGGEGARSCDAGR
nr:MAG TPA: hypothetical protein [Caudoviricetes sp.]